MYESDEEVEVVIRIPKEEYDLCKRTWDTECLDVLMSAVKYGALLEKGHGKIIDADAVIAEAKEKMRYPSNHKYMECVIATMILAPPVIPITKADAVIEADLTPKKDEPLKCDDCISRQAVLDMASTIQTDDGSGNELLEVVEVDDIKALPPVTPQPKLEQSKQSLINERLSEKEDADMEEER